jgi:hypothetical protein
VEIAGGRRGKPCQHVPIRILWPPFERAIRPLNAAKPTRGTALAYKPSGP